MKEIDLKNNLRYFKNKVKTRHICTIFYDISLSVPYVQMSNVLLFNQFRSDRVYYVIYLGLNLPHFLNILLLSWKTQSSSCCFLRTTTLLNKLLRGCSPNHYNVSHFKSSQLLSFLHIII